MGIVDLKFEETRHRPLKHKDLACPSKARLGAPFGSLEAGGQ